MDAFNTNDFTPLEVRLKKRRKISKEEEEAKIKLGSGIQETSMLSMICHITVCTLYYM